jgi:hypothetical protein
VTAAGEQVLAYAYSQVGMTESPPNSNLCSPYTDAWGPGAWCAMFVSYCDETAGYPLPPINGPAGFSYCPDGQIAAYTTGHALDASQVEPGDGLIFSWESWHMEGGIAVCSYGVYSGAPAGDHTGLFVGWLDGGYMITVEGNTSQDSWDNGGAVLERSDRHTSQICCYARHDALNTGGGSTQPPLEEEDDDLYKTCLVTTAGHPWNGSVFMVAGGRAVGMNDSALVADLQGRGLASPTISVEAWTIYGCYEVVYPSGPGAVPQ